MARLTREWRQKNRTLQQTAIKRSLHIRAFTTSSLLRPRSTIWPCSTLKSCKISIANRQEISQNQTRFFNFCQIDKFYLKWRQRLRDAKYLSWYHALNVPLCNAANHSIYESSNYVGSHIPLPLCHFFWTSLVSPFCKTSLFHYVWRIHLGQFLELNILPSHNYSAVLFILL